jgi:hypothetical protein
MVAFNKSFKVACGIAVLSAGFGVGRAMAGPTGPVAAVKSKALAEVREPRPEHVEAGVNHLRSIYARLKAEDFSEAAIRALSTSDRRMPFSDLAENVTFHKSTNLGFPKYAETPEVLAVTEVYHYSNLSAKAPGKNRFQPRGYHLVLFRDGEIGKFTECELRFPAEPDKDGVYHVLYPNSKGYDKGVPTPECEYSEEPKPE